MNALWKYWDWARFTDSLIDRENRHQDRAKIHEWWEVVHNQIWGKQTIITSKKPAAQKDKKQLADQMIGCGLNVAAIGNRSPENVPQIIAFLQKEIEDWCLTKSKKIDPKTGRSELQEKMKQKINEVWPYGPSEVHGPLQEDLYRFIENLDFISKIAY